MRFHILHIISEWRSGAPGGGGGDSTAEQKNIAQKTRAQECKIA